jgi:hypothetical protein
MSWYRIGEPGADTIAHLNFGRKPGAALCVAPRFEKDNPQWGNRCGRMSVALCDHPAGQDLAGKPLTCDAPMCELHRTKARGLGADVDHCPRHAKAEPAGSRA